MNIFFLIFTFNWARAEERVEEGSGGGSGDCRTEGESCDILEQAKSECCPGYSCVESESNAFEWISTDEMDVQLDDETKTGKCEPNHCSTCIAKNRGIH